MGDGWQPYGLSSVVFKVEHLKFGNKVFMCFGTARASLTFQEFGYG